MALRHIGGLSLAAAVLVACNNGYSVPDNSYPGGGGGNGNGSYGGGGVGTSGGDGDGGGSGSSGGYTSGGSSSGGSTGGTSSSGTGAGTSSSGGTSGGTSSGGTTGSGGSQLIGLLAFPVASAGQFLPIQTTDGGPTQMEFDLASYVLNCSSTSPQAGTTLVLILDSGDPRVPISSGTYSFPARGPGLPSASATLQETDGFGGVTIDATGVSGQVTWSYAFNGVATGSLSMNMSSDTGVSYLTGIFSAPYCGSF